MTCTTGRGGLLATARINAVTASMAALTLFLLVFLVVAVSASAEHDGRDQMSEAADIAERMLAEWKVPKGASEDVTETSAVRVTPDGAEYIVKLHYYASSGRKLFSVDETVLDDELNGMEKSVQAAGSGAVVSNFDSKPVRGIAGGTKEAWDRRFTIRPGMHPGLIVVKSDERIVSFEDAVEHAQMLLTDEPDPSVDKETVRRFTEIAADPWSWEWQIFRPAKGDTENSYYILALEKEVDGNSAAVNSEGDGLNEAADTPEIPEEKQKIAMNELENNVLKDSVEDAAPAGDGEGALDTLEQGSVNDTAKQAKLEKNKNTGFFARLMRKIFGFFM